MDISNMRIPYRENHDNFDLNDITKKNPIDQFMDWFKHAVDAKVYEPNGMVLATATHDGIPSARFVLLKSVDDRGFIFFTNYESRKGKELKKNPHASLVFYWEPLRRQVRVEGSVTKLPEFESDKYFNSRPKDSRIGACISQQSQPIPSRQFLMDAYAELHKQFEGEEIVPRPSNWGGYIVNPSKVEFWQGQTNRVHDRFIFRKLVGNEKPDGISLHQGDKDWVYERLAP